MDGAALASSPEVRVTHELELILSTDVAAGETLKVSAAAGAGKSTALRMYSAQRPQLQTLYLTFTTAEADAKAADYARRGFHHVTVSTLHALAFSATTDLHGGQVAESLSLSAAYLARLTSTSSMDWPRARRDEVCCVIGRFLASDAPDLCVSHLEAVSSDGRGLLGAAQAVWRAACNPDEQVTLTHDMYLKMCAVQPARRARMFGEATLVLLDEAHDCTEAQIALAAAPARTWGLVLVYDFFQRLYGWRHAATASYVRALPAIAIRELTFSWRFGTALAKLASALLSRHTGATVVVQSSATHTTSILEVPLVPFVRVCGVGIELAVVARTRRALFNTAMHALASGAVGCITFAQADSMFGSRDQLLDTYALYVGRAQHDMLCPDQGAARFADHGYAQYRRVAYTSRCQDAIEACEAVEKFGSALPQLLRKLDEALRASCSRSLVLLSVHEAKGREWAHVYLHPDLICSSNHTPNEQLYRLNLLYVAMTRAAAALYIPSALVAFWFCRVGINYRMC